MPPNVLAEGGAGELASFPEVDGVPKGGRKRLCARVGVRVADQLRPRVGAALDAVKPGGEQGRVAEIRVYVGARYPALGAPRLPVADDTKARRAVVAGPGDRGRGPALGRIALVGVDRRREEQRELPDPSSHAAEIVSKHLGLLVAVDKRA